MSDFQSAAKCEHAFTEMDQQRDDIGIWRAENVRQSAKLPIKITY